MFGSTGSRASDLAADIDRLRADVSTLAENVALLVRDRSEGARSRFTQTRHELGEQLDERLSAWGRTGAQVAGEARDRLAGANARLETSIGERPLVSVLAAAGVGFILGIMSSRGRR